MLARRCRHRCKRAMERSKLNEFGEPEGLNNISNSLDGFGGEGLFGFSMKVVEFVANWKLLPQLRVTPTRENKYANDEPTSQRIISRIRPRPTKM